MSQTLIDTKKLGREYKLDRLRAGFKNTKEFVAHMEDVTGYEMSYQTMQRIESGAKEPKVSEQLAIEATLFDKLATKRRYIEESLTPDFSKAAGKQESTAARINAQAMRSAFEYGFQRYIECGGYDEYMTDKDIELEFQRDYDLALRIALQLYFEGF